MRELAAGHGDNGSRLTILADWDISGRREKKKKEKKGRPGYLELEAAIRSGECTAVYSYSLSRLSPSVSDLSALFDLCKDHKVPIRLVADNLDTSAASGLTAHILAGMAQFESDVASERVAGMYETKRANGEEIRTSRRYGEQKVLADGTTAGDGEDEAVVLAAFDEAGTYSGAARLLNARGVKPRMAEYWWASSVAVVVKRRRPALANRAPSRGVDASGSAFRLARLLRCPTCGRFLTGANGKQRNGTRRVVYTCRNADAMPHPKVVITESIILPWLKREADRRVVPDSVETSMGLNEERERLEAKLREVPGWLMDGSISRDDARELTTEIRSRLAALVDAGRVVDVPALSWDSFDPGYVNRILRDMWAAVVLDANLHPVDVEWRWPPEYLTPRV